MDDDKKNIMHYAVLAANNAIRNTAELGAFAAGGLLVTAIGPRGTLAYAGGLSALAGVVGLLALLRLKESEPSTEIASVPPELRTETDGLRNEDSRHRA